MEIAESLERELPASVRADIREAHGAAWHHLASAGSWWAGAERVDIAREARGARGCAFCRARKDAASPYMTEGTHDTATALPAVAVDAIHRLVTDPGRLGRRFYDDVLAGGRGDGRDDARYVELLGVVLTVVTVDTFHRALGAPLRPLPTPLAGEPDGRRPPSTDRLGAWVPTLDYAQATDLSRKVAAARRAPNVIQALSLVPSELEIRFALAAAQYVPGSRTIDVRYSGDRALSRAQIELLATKVSTIQECFY